VKRPPLLVLKETIKPRRRTRTSTPTRSTSRDPAVLNEAEIAGARLHSACHVIGVSARTIQSLEAHDGVAQMLPSQTCVNRGCRSIQTYCYCFIQTEQQMAKAIATKRSA
jgi:hypothetical protein